MKHSPGPWRKGGACRWNEQRGDFDECEFGMDVWDADGGPVTDASDWFNADDVTLIAAAPDMLKVLSGYAKSCNHDTGWCQYCPARLLLSSFTDTKETP